MAPIPQSILDAIGRGECVQVIGIPGMGISRLGLALGGLHINSGLYPNFTSDQYIALIPSSPPPDLVVFDSIDRLLKPGLTPFFSFLKALRDKHKYQLKYVFLNHTAHPISPTHQPLLSTLFSLLSENIYYLQPIPPSQISNRIINDFSPDLGFSPNKQQIQEISDLTGGIPVLIKIIIQSMRNQSSYDPVANPRLKAQLAEIRDSLGSSPSPDLLNAHGLLDQSGQIRSRLLTQFLSQKTDLSLTETRLLEFLKTRPGQLVTKDQICEAVYPDVKNRTGISDHAIDQLIHRLRDKIRSDYHLVTRRGLGYLLHPL